MKKISQAQIDLIPTQKNEKREAELDATSTQQCNGKEEKVTCSPGQKIMKLCWWHCIDKGKKQLARKR